MYQLDIKGTFSIISDREELYNELEYIEGLNEVVKTLRLMDKEKEEEYKAVQIDLRERLEQCHDFAGYLLKSNKLDDREQTKLVLEDIQALSDNQYFEGSEFWSVK